MAVECKLCGKVLYNDWLHPDRPVPDDVGFLTVYDGVIACEECYRERLCDYCGGTSLPVGKFGRWQYCDACWGEATDPGQDGHPPL